MASTGPSNTSKASTQSSTSSSVTTSTTVDQSSQWTSFSEDTNIKDTINANNWDFGKISNKNTSNTNVSNGLTSSNSNKKSKNKKKKNKSKKSKNTTNNNTRNGSKQSMTSNGTSTGISTTSNADKINGIMSNKSQLSGRLQLLINSMPKDLRSKFEYATMQASMPRGISKFSKNNESIDSKKVLIITDNRFVSKPICRYLTTTIRVAGFTVTTCDNVEQPPLKWKIINKEENNDNNNNSNTSNKYNDNMNESKDDTSDKTDSITTIQNDQHNQHSQNGQKQQNGYKDSLNKSKIETDGKEAEFEDLDLSPSLSDFDILFIPTQIKASLWNDTILHQNNGEGAHVINDDVNNATKINKSMKSITNGHRSNNNNNTNNDINNSNSNDNKLQESEVSVYQELVNFVKNGGVLLTSHFRACELLNGVTGGKLGWHETSIRIGKSKVCLEMDRVNGVTSRAKSILSQVNDIRGIIGVNVQHSIYKSEDFTTIARYPFGLGILAYIGHDFNAILAKDWNNVTFLLMKKQLILTQEYKNLVNEKFSFDIDKIKKLNEQDEKLQAIIDNNNNKGNDADKDDEEDDDDWSPFGDDDNDGDNTNNNGINGINSGNEKDMNYGFEPLPDNDDEDISDQMEQDSVDMPLTNLTSIKE